MPDYTRRYLLQLIGLSTIGTTSGCNLLSEPKDTETEVDTPADTETPTAAPTPTESPTQTPTESPADTETDTPEEETATEKEEGFTAYEHVLNLKPGKNASRTESTVFNNDSEYINEESPELEINLGEMNQLHTNDFDAVVKEGFYDRDWEKWLESADEPNMLQELKSKVLNAPGDEYSADTVRESESVRQAMRSVLPYMKFMQGMGADAELSEEEKNKEYYLPDNIPKISTLAENGIRESSNLSDFHIFTHPAYEDKSGNGVEDGRYPMVTILDAEAGQTVFTEVNPFGEEFFETQKKFLTRKFNGDHEAQAQDHPRWKEGFPLLENSVFLPYFGKEEYNMEEVNAKDWEGLPFEPFTVNDVAEKAPAQEYWHPLRFGGYEPDGRFFPEDHFEKGTPDDPNPNDDQTPTPYEETATPGPDDREDPPWAFPTYKDHGLDYETAARLAATTLRRMVSSTMDDDITVTMEETDKVGVTRGYLSDVIDEMRTVSTEEDLQKVYDNAKALHKTVETAEETGEKYILQGTADNPIYSKPSEDLKVDSKDPVQALWEDENGEHDNFIQEYLDGNIAVNSAADNVSA